MKSARVLVRSTDRAAARQTSLNEVSVKEVGGSEEGKYKVLAGCGLVSADGMRCPTTHRPRIPPFCSSPTQPDPYYGNEQTSGLCANLPPATSLPVRFNCEAPVFHRLRPSLREVAPSVTFASLVLLQRLKAHFPTALRSSGY